MDENGCGREHGLL